jgi:hypothetical protein
LEHPFDLRNPRDLVQIHTKATDDLPNHIKQDIFWSEADGEFPNHIKQDIFWSEADGEFPAGYYLTNRQTNIDRQVEFVDHYWHYIFRYHGDSFTSLIDRINHHTEETGYWAI